MSAIAFQISMKCLQKIFFEFFFSKIGFEKEVKGYIFCLCFMFYIDCGCKKASSDWRCLESNISADHINCKIKPSQFSLDLKHLPQ